MTRPTKAIAGIVLVLALWAAVYGWLVLQHGFSARDQPLAIEAFVARRFRHLAIPRGAREQANPVKATPEVLRSGLEHFADHCASCHANNGSGDTEMGRNLYPKAPDMRLAQTQDLSDGELFYIIENGIRLTGMPAWGNGTPESASASWALVHFLRRVPTLTPAEIGRMKALNPRGPEEWQEEEATRQFLEGREAPPTSPSISHQHKEQP
jgi:mono/diheme cytochrome c family protein